MEGGESDFEKEDDEKTEILRDRFRFSVISIAEAEAKKNDMEISKPVMTCIADLTFKLAEQLAKDLKLFAHHGDHKIVNVDDVILSAHRNEHLATLLRTFSSGLKGKEPQVEKKAQLERKRKKSSRKEDITIPD